MTTFVEAALALTRSWLSATGPVAERAEEQPAYR
jgi:hypothetical protein